MADEKVELSIVMEDGQETAEILERQAAAMERGAAAAERTAAAWREVSRQGMPPPIYPSGMGTSPTQEPYRYNQFGGQPIASDPYARFEERQAAVLRAFEQRAAMQQRERDLLSSGYYSGYDRLGMANSTMATAMSGGHVGVTSSILGSAMQQLAAGFNAMGNSTMTATQRIQAFSEGLPVIGTLIAGLRQLSESIMGVSDRIRMATQFGEITRTMQAGTLRTTMARYGGMTEVGEQQGRLIALAGTELQGFEGLGVGDIGALNDPMRRASWERQIGIAGQRDAIRANIGAVEGRMAGLRTEREVLEIERQRATMNLEQATEREQGTRKSSFTAFNYLTFGAFDGANKASLTEAVTARANAATNLKQIEEKIAENIEKEKASTQELARERNREARVMIELDRERLQVLREQEGMIRQQSHGFGRMTGAERQYMLNLARKFKERGGAGMLPQELDQLNAVLPYQVGRAFEARGEAAPELQAIRGLFPGDPASGGLAANLRGQTDLQKRLYELTAKAEADLGRTLEDGLGRFLQSLIKQLSTVLKAQSDEMTLGMRMRNVINGNR